MAQSAKNITIHTKKFFRVVLESVDPTRETPDSFAIKLSMRTRTSLPRAKIVLKKLPFTLKSGLSSAQANRLKSVIEDIGGKVRLESHLVTPGVTDDGNPPDLRSPEGGTGEPVICPSCGWEEESGARYCALCLRRFRDPNRVTSPLGEKLPQDNPLEDVGPPGEDQWEAALSYLKRHQLPVLLGIIAVLVLILIAK